MSRDESWIEELEHDLGQAARLRLIANVGGQRRRVPTPEGAAGSQLAGELGLPIAAWLAERFGGENVDVPSARGRDRERSASLLRAAILDAGLEAPSRSANSLAAEFGVTSTHVHRLRSQLRAERAGDLPLGLR